MPERGRVLGMFARKHPPALDASRLLAGATGSEPTKEAAGSTPRPDRYSFPITWESRGPGIGTIARPP
jgi:hypothetical protein